MTKTKLVKHRVGRGPGDYLYVKKDGIEGVRFLPVLRKVFPNLHFADPFVRGFVFNPIYVAATTNRTAWVYVLNRDDRGKLLGVCPPVRLRLSGNLEADVLTWYRCMREVYRDLGLGLHLEDLVHHVHCLTAGKKLKQATATAAIRILKNVYRTEESV